MQTGAIVAPITGNLTGLGEAFAAALGMGNKFSQDWSGAVSSWVGNVAANLTSQVVGMAKNSFAGMAGQLDVMDATAKAADMLGMTTSSLVSMQHAAAMADVQSSDLTNTLRLLINSLAEATNSAGPAAESLKVLGLNASMLASMDVDQAVGVIADAINRVPDAAQRAMLMINIFGKSAGAELADMLAGGSKGLRDAADEAESMGLALNDIDYRKAQEAGDAMKRVGEVFTAAGQRMMAILAPALSQISDWVALLGSGLNAMDGPFTRAVLTGLAFGVAIGGLIFVVTNFHATIMAVATAFKVATLAEIVFQGFSGPAGWALIAAGVVAVGAAVLSLGGYLDDAATGAGKLKGAMPGDKSAVTAVMAPKVRTPSDDASDYLNDLNIRLLQAKSGFNATDLDIWKFEKAGVSGSLLESLKAVAKEIQNVQAASENAAAFRDLRDSLEEQWATLGMSNEDKDLRKLRGSLRASQALEDEIRGLYKAIAVRSASVETDKESLRVRQAIANLGKDAGQVKLDDLISRGAGADKIKELKDLLDSLALATRKQSLDADVASTTKDLLDQLDTFGLAGGEAAVVRFQIQGATPEQLAEMRNLLQQLNSQQLAAKQQQEMNTAIDSFRQSLKTPADIFNETLEDYKNWLALGKISQAEYEKGVNQAAERMATGSITGTNQRASLMLAGSASAQRLQYELASGVSQQREDLARQQLQEQRNGNTTLGEIRDRLEFNVAGIEEVA